MDVTESAYLPVETVVKPAAPGDGMFDFVDSQADPDLKSLGVFVEPNNNAQVKVEAAFDSSIFWSDKEGALLDDITPWGEWSESKPPSADSADTSAYTLTVLNSNEPWTKVPDKSKKADSNLDLESFLNILPEAESDSSSYFYPEYPTFVDPKDVSPSPSTNNNDWKALNNNNSDNNINESLLRNALQGRSGFHRSYGLPCKKDNRDCVTQYADTSIAHFPPENGASDQLDNIFGFTPLEHYREDYDKIKKIANEFVDCSKYPMPHCGDMGYGPATAPDAYIPSNLQVVSPSGKCFNKKFSKKSIPSPNSKANGSSARKERSLHYCSICAKGFKDKYSVNVHVRTHTGEKPFNCNLCGKSFRQKAHLAKHYQTHLAQSQKQQINGAVTSSSNSATAVGGAGPSSSRPRPKVAVLESQHR